LPRYILSQKKISKFVKKAKNNVEAISSKCGVSHMTIQSELKKSGMEYRKRKKVPKYT